MTPAETLAALDRAAAQYDRADAHGARADRLLGLPPRVSTVAHVPRPAPVPCLAAETAHAQRCAGTLPTARARGGAR